MGTSVKMLEEHYSHFSVSDNPNLFSGHARRQQTDKDKEIEELKKQIEELKKENEKR
jgi:archaellum component FlaC